MPKMPSELENQRNLEASIEADAENVLLVEMISSRSINVAFIF